MTIHIHELRLSLIWLHQLDVATLLPPLSQREIYCRTFRTDGLTSSLELPWPSPEGQHFWQYYLETEDLSTLDCREAWRHLMPFYFPIPISLSVPQEISAASRVSTAVFCYPHAVGTIITFYLCGDMTLEEAVQYTTQARYSISHRTLLPMVIQWVRDTLTNAEPLTAMVWRQLPLSITTVLDATGVSLPLIIQQDDDIHRALEAWCTFPRRHITTSLPSLVSAQLPFDHRENPLGSTLYRSERGCAVWFPGYFSEHIANYCTVPTKHQRWLGHYHRNLTLLTLQTESLLIMAHQVASFLRNRQATPLYLEDLARHAAGALGRLFGGKGTYKSWNAHRQIEPHTDVVNLLRKQYGLPLLHAEVPPQ